MARGGLALGVVGLLMLAIAVVPSLAGFRTGIYPGTTSQATNLSLQVMKKKKVNVVFFELLSPPCAGQYAGLEAKLRKNGKFKALSPADGLYGYVKGKVNGNKASGTARYTHPELPCDSGEVTWTAEKE